MAYPLYCRGTQYLSHEPAVNSWVNYRDRTLIRSIQGQETLSVIFSLILHLTICLAQQPSS